MRSRSFLLLGIALLVGMGLSVGLLAAARPYVYQGSLIDPPATVADFQLTDQHGRLFRLNDQKGKTLLVFFGYTNCPDVCPLTLTDFRSIKAQLGEQAGQVRFIFITTDPERDDPRQIKEYLSKFDPEFLGLTGSQAELEPVWRDYGIYQEKVDSGHADSYLVDHTSRVYAIDKDGNLRLTYLFGTESQAIAEDITHLLTKK